MPLIFVFFSFNFLLAIILKAQMVSWVGGIDVSVVVIVVVDFNVAASRGVWLIVASFNGIICG